MTLDDKIALVKQAVSQNVRRGILSVEEAAAGCEEDFRVYQQCLSALHRLHDARERVTNLIHAGVYEDAAYLGSHSPEARRIQNAESHEEAARKRLGELAAKLDEIIVRRGLLD